MKEDLKFFGSFKQIEKGKENEGYLEWRDSVERVLKRMDKHNLCNMQKRVYLSLERSRKSEDGFAQINSLIVLSVTIIIALYNMALEVFKQEQMMVVKAFTIGGSIIVVCVAASMIKHIYKYDKKVARELYYAELLDIINDVVAMRRVIMQL